MGFASKSHFSFHVLYLFGCTVDFFFKFFFLYSLQNGKRRCSDLCFIQMKPSLTSECKHSLLRVIITPVHITSTMSGIKNAIADRQVGVY